MTTSPPDPIGCFDRLHGDALHGWALDRSRPSETLEIEAVGPDGSVLGRARADRFRGDLLDAGLRRGLCAFTIDIAARDAVRLVGQPIVARIAGTFGILPGSPRILRPNPNLGRFLARETGMSAAVRARLCRALTFRARPHGVSLVMRVHDTPEHWLRQSLDGVRDQYCGRWELIVIDDAARPPPVARLLAAAAAEDDRIRILTTPETVGYARAINFGLRAARHDHVAVVDPADRLEPDAIWQLLHAAHTGDADLLYADELLMGGDGHTVAGVRLRPAFGEDGYMSRPFAHPVALRTALAHAIGGVDERLTDAADIDFLLRAIERMMTHGGRVTHVPAILNRRRAADDDAARSDATRDALQRHLDRVHAGARVAFTPDDGGFRVDWPDPGGLVLVVIPTRNNVRLLRDAVASVERHRGGERIRLVVVDHGSDDPDSVACLDALRARHVVMPFDGDFNFARMNNRAAATHGRDADFVLLMNNDVAATADGWIARLRSIAARPDIGAVGPLLMYGDKHVQHAGVILGFEGSAEHAHRGRPVYLDASGARAPGRDGALTATRDVSALTAACVLLRRAVWDEVGGLDEALAVGFNDVDLCLRLRARGYRLIYDGATVLYHHESATRHDTGQVFHPADTALMRARWGAALAGDDPFYHPNLSRDTRDHVPREDNGCRIASAPRTVRLPPAATLAGAGGRM